MSSAPSQAGPGDSRQPRLARPTVSVRLPPSNEAGPTASRSDTPFDGTPETESTNAGDFGTATDYAMWVIENPHNAYQRLRNLELGLARAQKSLREAIRVQKMDADRPQRSSKLPDVPILTDGKSPTFEGWMLKLMNKFMLNKDHYPTECHKMAYIHSRCEGPAEALLTPRAKCGAKNPFINAEEMIHYLQSFFHNTHRRAIAGQEFEALIMKKDEQFHDFYIKFACLAVEAESQESYLKHHLFRKLSNRLKSLVMNHFYDENITMTQFVETCRRSATALLVENEIRKRA
ncbi:hypothetical protein N7466_003281 [Penicillium verhagenii]|uniref:uncharacterized protein n=1 Tax=Penicillium verhagenii TaxID=1562060 RepID=UPI0025452B5D|nr:uncharacterized protein N7466_003281 [Penicillium verhagenii]KAJ5936831.1 hypothetical protein N7466_003281 [Penicillium verhagenii]